MVLPILEAKYDLGLFEHPYADESKVDATLSRSEGLALERKLSSRSIVLLRSENRALPLSKSLNRRRMDRGGSVFTGKPVTLALEGAPPLDIRWAALAAL